MRLLTPVRYVLFGAVAAGIAVVIFYVLGLLIGPHFQIGADLIERWMVRSSCETYELAGNVHDSRGAPIPFAVVEVIYNDQRLTTRSGTDGAYRVVAKKRVCDPKPETVTATVRADSYRGVRRFLSFTLRRFDFALEDEAGPG